MCPLAIKIRKIYGKSERTIWWIILFRRMNFRHLLFIFILCWACTFENKNSMPDNDKSSHILNTSSNLLGFCLVIITSLKVSNYSEKTLIDEFTAISALLFMVSSILSFLSIRTQKVALSVRYEAIADNLFLLALLFIFFTVALITLRILV